MSKNNQKENVKFSKQKGSITATITANLNKHGEVKGANKKETKALRAICTHHKLNKKGKIKAAVINDGNGYCQCTICGAKFRASLFEDDKLDKVITNMNELVNQMKFMSVALDTGKETEQYLADMAIKISHVKKTYNKFKHIVNRNENIKKGKNKNKNQYSGSESYGGWRN